MQFSIPQKELMNALAIVSKAISSNNTLQVLDNILIRAEGSGLTFVATDLEISIETRGEAKIEEEGAITIPAKLLVQYVGLLPESAEIQFKVSGNGNIDVESGVSQTKMKGIDAGEFPMLPTFEAEKTLQIQRGDFLTAVAQALFSTSSNTTRPILAGVYFTIKEGKLYLVSTDSFRLSEKSVDFTITGEAPELGCIIPAKTLQDMMRVFAKEGEKEPITLDIAQNQVRFTSGDTTLMSRVIKGAFPDYTQIIPKEKNVSLVVPTKDFLLNLKRIHLFAKETNFHVQFEIKPSEQRMYMHTESSQIGEEHATQDVFEAEGTDMTIALNSQYVIDICSNIGGDFLRLECASAGKPAKFIPLNHEKKEDLTYLHLIMPLKSK